MVRVAGLAPAKPSRFERDASSLGYTRMAYRAVARSEGWCPRSDLHRHCARFKCAVSALDYVGLSSAECRVRNEQTLAPDAARQSAFSSPNSAFKMVPREGFPPPTSP